MAENLIGSEIIKLAAEIQEKIRNGERIFNYTIGDFDPRIFPIPQELNDEIITAYQNHQTNYPAANGMPELRKVVSEFLNDREGLSYSPDEILISGGARPLIYATYITLLDKGDTVVFPVPSWNNNHYCHLSEARSEFIETQPDNDFMPTAEEIRPHLKNATLLSLCSPLNPTGTVFDKEQLTQICDLVLEENRRRSPEQKPLYLMYDQIYWVLTFGKTEHFNPVSLRPEMREYTIFIDGISKSLAATGVRVGWAFGPQRIMDKMRAILSHVGAWAPKAEQVATAKYLQNKTALNIFLEKFKAEIDMRLHGFYDGFMELKKAGYKVHAIAPQAAIYLTIQLDLKGMKTKNGVVLETQRDVTQHILDEAKLAVVPFSAFGSSDDSTWYRLSVGTCNASEIPDVFLSLKKVLSELS
ncbi:MAG: aminotransferase class I/II-fold pyridoxal phosphate-dependent enzyme [Bacteroidetes bacterium]|nr:aminotransferase class I/II-fold pyridoxal phosphate-dependent enzyme [Bacteroidota bacterium]MBP6402283.1 aminotransferase class I/II-fold pyridoxal phosphate-dependent enzyme [Bacteroidia bacterium]MBK6837151.1 aminotransferase class I/II-fold pyridoxal phosphate-dependent enzyme [Bacteroidota bacterium]MBK9523457.1 aminotransferase class I/II-fold pyridoxal phosphate-dependent enzyme [Bacteroidota bacterium]MBK9541202.1 aminotransferase class I/II-fold pyridoxal phosphate-dependent enzyme